MGEERTLHPEPTLVIGVDGGGTKTTAWLACVDAKTASGHDPTVIGTGTSGTSNPTRIGVSAATDAIADAINLAFTHAGLTPAKAASLAAGVAGTGQASLRSELERALNEAGLAERVHVTDDVSPVWHAARRALQQQTITPQFPAVVVASGTGSMVWGTDQAGKTARSGGLGAETGDPGSGYAIGLAALHAGIVELEQTDIQRASDPEIQQVTRIAQLAQIVITKHGHDPGAEAIVEQAAQDLAELAQDVAGQLAPQPDGLAITLVTTGSVLTKTGAVTDRLIRQLDNKGISVTSHTPIDEPVRGALLLAIKNMQTG